MVIGLGAVVAVVIVVVIQVASFGWRYAPLLTVIFHGKNRHLSGGRAK
jgi:hypothetical protein